MDKLNFLGSLDEEQKQNAEKVARFAVEAGVDPYLAVAIAYKEGSLRTNTPRGKSGEIGMMQVMPKTGMDLGYDEKKLSNPNQNIKAGVQYLKQGLQAAENSPELAAIYYNGGPGALEAPL
jgi:soluble lytic murein transglycosylase-like protein